MTDFVDEVEKVLRHAGVTVERDAVLPATPLTSTEGGTMSAVAAEPDYSPEAYQLAIPGMDGYKADRLGVTFAGGVDLDRTSQDDLDFVNGLKLGREITLRVTAVVTKKGFTLTSGKEDTADQTGYGVGLKVHSLEVV